MQLNINIFTFIPLLCRMHVTFPSASGDEVPLSMTLLMSQGKLVWRAKSIKLSTPKSEK